MLTRHPVVSIVLPTYNGAKFLRESIDSCLRQTLSDLELVVVDDASTDETPIIVREYVQRDARVRSVRHEQNRRLPAALNRGFTEARGEFLSWTSDDNCYRPTAMEEMVAHLRRNPEVGVAYCGYTVIDPEGAEVGRGWIGSLEQLPFHNVVGPCFLYRRRVHEELGGFAEDLFLVEDYDFWLRAAARFSLTPIRKDLYLFRTHGASLTRTRAAAVRVAHEQCLARNLPHLHWMDARLATAAYRHLIGIASARGARGAALLHFVNALRRYPAVADLRTLATVLLPTTVLQLVDRRLEHRQRADLRRALERVMPKKSRFILVDDTQAAISAPHGSVAVPFLERAGQYWGPPADDVTAINELKRLRQEGASAVVIAAPSFWWLEHYTMFAAYIRENFRCVLETDRVLVFDLADAQDVRK